ncbi:hypothetical protein ACWDNT_09890, partial [Streptomyces sp. NPDC000963]
MDHVPGDTSPASATDVLPDVAPQLRALRRRRGLTLEAAARRAEQGDEGGCGQQDAAGPGHGGVPPPGISTSP